MASSIRPASRAEAAHLSDVALRSKGLWGYDREFLERCRDELTITPEMIEEHQVYVLEEDDIKGFYVLEEHEGEWELSYLYVEPSAVGGGRGRRLLEHAVRGAQAAGASRLVIEADPHAEPFYLARGARRVGERASGSIPGRSLPLLELPVPGAGSTDD